MEGAEEEEEDEEEEEEEEEGWGGESELDTTLPTILRVRRRPRRAVRVCSFIGMYVPCTASRRSPCRT